MCMCRNDLHNIYTHIHIYVYVYTYIFAKRD